MNVSLTKELETYVRRKVESGLYQSAGEVIGEGLRLMKERDELYQLNRAALHREIDVGVDQANCGRMQPFDEETAARVKARGRERLAVENGADPA
ncbi:MAG: hypothetical protein NVSMB14_02250 [Isosphaeraceae bacterium]